MKFMRKEKSQLMLKMQSNIIQKVRKYYLAGGICIVIDFSITMLLVKVFNCIPIYSHYIGWLLGLIGSFCLNRLWVFPETSLRLWSTTARFVLWSLVSMGITSLIIIGLNSILLIDFFVSKTVAIAFVSILNYMVNSSVVFVQSCSYDREEGGR